MTDRNPSPPPKQLEGWESWPLWALGLSNGLNIVLWYVLSMTRVESPELPIGVLAALAAWLPLIVVAGGIAQALSLDGALIATIAGARHGRRGPWTWLTIFGAGLFSAAISYAVHSGRIDQLPILHVASAVNLVFYNMHLAQPRKVLQPDAGTASDLPASVAGDYQITEIQTPAHLPALIGDAQSRLFPCKYCNAPVTLAMAGQHGKRYKLEGRCVAE